jgi:hypothetical protein
MERSKTGLNSAAIVIWLLVQLAALTACAARITFWARSPAAGEQLALAVMLCVQVGTSAVIFPYLLSDRSSTILAIVTGWPLAQLAAYLSDASLTQATGGELYVSAWLLGLAFYSPLLRSESAKLIGAALAGMIAIGGSLVLYLRLEFAAGASAAVQSIAWFGPVEGALSQIWPTGSSAGSIVAWAIPAALIAIGAGLNFAIWKRRDNSRQVIH